MQKKMEYSKKIVLFTGVLFVSTVVAAIYFAYKQLDTSVFAYILPSTGGIFGAAIIFYLNKAKMENVCKGKIAFFKFKMRYLAKHPEQKEQLESELSVIDNALSTKMDSAVESAIADDINIQTY